MQKINMHDAKTNLSRLVDEVVKNGDSFIISKAGKPMVKVVRINAPTLPKRQRLGFLKNQLTIPDDFDSMGEEKITQLFSGRI
jgi:prevent-host-death family protein